MLNEFRTWLRRLRAGRKHSPARRKPSPIRPDFSQLEERTPVSEQIGPFLTLSVLSLTSSLAPPIVSPLDSGGAAAAGSSTAPAVDPAGVAPTGTLPAEPPEAPVTPPQREPEAGTAPESFSQQPDFVAPSATTWLRSSP